LTPSRKIFQGGFNVLSDLSLSSQRTPVSRRTRFYRKTEKKNYPSIRKDWKDDHGFVIKHEGKLVCNFGSYRWREDKNTLQVRELSYQEIKNMPAPRGSKVHTYGQYLEKILQEAPGSLAALKEATFFEYY